MMGFMPGDAHYLCPPFFDDASHMFALASFYFSSKSDKAFSAKPVVNVGELIPVHW